MPISRRTVAKYRMELGIGGGRSRGRMVEGTSEQDKWMIYFTEASKIIGTAESEEKIESAGIPYAICNFT